MYRYLLMVSPHGIIYTKITPSASQTTVAMTFPAEGVALKFSRGGDG
jgi:hypothetical protein